MSDNELNPWQQWRKNLGTTRPWDLLNKEVEQATEEVVQKRLEICNSCPKLVQLTKQCKLCGCVMPLKAKLKQAVCPANKWTE